MQFASAGQPAISPHLDAFAKQGTLFRSAYVQVAWCSPCRNSFLSGRRPDRTRIWTTPGTEPGKGFRAAGPDWVTLPGYFKAAGYIVTAGGKVFHPEEPNDNDPISWTDVAPGESESPPTHPCHSSYPSFPDTVRGVISALPALLTPASFCPAPAVSPHSVPELQRQRPRPMHPLAVQLRWIRWLQRRQHDLPALPPRL